MARAWEAVAAWEARNGYRFDAVCFSRPDILFSTGYGPLCAYDWSRTWYATWGRLTPDMFWLLPRDWAANVLTTWSRVVLPCVGGQLCCNLSASFASKAERATGSARVPYSVWLTTYWSRARAYRLNRTGLRGYGVVGASPKAGRKCTLPLLGGWGCPDSGIPAADEPFVA